MKLLFIVEFFPTDSNLIFTGGVEAYNYYLIKELAKKHEIVVICRRITGSIDQNFIKSSFGKNTSVIFVGKTSNKIDTCISTIPGRLNFFFSAIKIGLQQDFDLVQSNNFLTHPVAFIIGTLKNKPKIAWYPDTYLNQWVKLVGLLSGLIGEAAERIILTLPWSHVIALSKVTYETLKKHINTNKLSYVYGGVDTGFFDRIPIVETKNFTVITVSRLVWYKRVDLIIRAVKILQDKGVKVSLKIIGDGPEKENLIQIRNELKIHDIAFLSGLNRDELGRELKSSNLFCLASEKEGFGLVIIEAAACGVPYIITNLPVLKEVTHNGLGGMYFKKGDPQDLAEKIEDFIKNKSIKYKLKEQTDILAGEYTWQKAAESFNQVYEKYA